MAVFANDIINEATSLQTLYTGLGTNMLREFQAIERTRNNSMRNKMGHESCDLCHDVGVHTALQAAETIPV